MQGGGTVVPLLQYSSIIVILVMNLARTRKVVLTITIASSEENDTRNKFAIIVEVLL